MVAGIFWGWSVNPDSFLFDIVIQEGLIFVAFSTTLSCL